MNILKLQQLQKSYGVQAVQNQIDSGMAWKLEGSVGRFASDMLEAGVCMLPLVSRCDYYGNTVPSRHQIKAGSKGSYKNCSEFWQKVWDGDFETIESLENCFGAETEDEVQ
jgi:hypothetical protein